MSQSDRAVDFTGGLYWRKSKWNARACVPVILRVSGGRLRMRDDSGQVLDAACADVVAKQSRLKTLTLQVGGRKYDLVGRGGQISKPFSQQMRADLAGALQEGAGVVGAASFDPSRGLVAADIVSLANTDPWVDVLRSAGATMS